jgi:hypothetical protein
MRPDHVQRRRPRTTVRCVQRVLGHMGARQALAPLARLSPLREQRTRRRAGSSSKRLCGHPASVRRLSRWQVPVHVPSSASVPVSQPPGLTLSHWQAHVVVAQDANGRHVVLKLSKARSAECTVYEMLAQDRTLLDVNDFPGVLPPIELLPWGSDHIVIVLPRCEYNLFQIGRFSLTYARWGLCAITSASVPTLNFYSSYATY